MPTTPPRLPQPLAGASCASEPSLRMVGRGLTVTRDQVAAVACRALAPRRKQRPTANAGQNRVGTARPVGGRTRLPDTFAPSRSNGLKMCPVTYDRESGRSQGVDVGSL